MAESMLWFALGMSLCFNILFMYKMQKQEKALVSCRDIFVALVKYHNGLKVPAYLLKSVKPCDRLDFSNDKDKMLNIVLK
jgi:hypothetical protein